jgi:D-arabinose 1-dehydrogenase-like Zn-dependent alcohol dehydrogenase
MSLRRVRKDISLRNMPHDEDHFGCHDPVVTVSSPPEYRCLQLEPYPNTMKVAQVINTDSPLEVKQIEKPVPGYKDVLVRVEACGLVPNTAKLVTGESIEEGMILATSPIVFGLDAAGVVESVGEHVLNIKAGDRVYIDPWITCDTCSACRRGQFFA